MHDNWYSTQLDDPHQTIFDWQNMWPTLGENNEATGRLVRTHWPKHLQTRIHSSTLEVPYSRPGHLRHEGTTWGSMWDSFWSTNHGCQGITSRILLVDRTGRLHWVRSQMHKMSRICTSSKWRKECSLFSVTLRLNAFVKNAVTFFKLIWFTNAAICKTTFVKPHL